MLFVPNLCLYENLYIFALIFLILNAKFNLFYSLIQYYVENLYPIFSISLNVLIDNSIFNLFNFLIQFICFYIVISFELLNLNLSPFLKGYDCLLNFNN